jgi:mannose-6-phosphate isomerase-like protein (cupin superfamily)
VSDGWRAVRVQDVEAVPWRGTELVWHPLRAALGLRAFGAAAYTASRVGQLLVEPHQEDVDGRGHEELYVVLEGAARFELDGSVVEARAGTCVMVRPSTFRVAFASEVPATVLAFGAPPTFEIAGGEWVDRARPLFASDPVRARALLQEGLAELPSSPGILYGFALLAFAEGRLDDARSALADAVAREPLLLREAADEPELFALLESG